jgi:putative sigma-54 modulation protein
LAGSAAKREQHFSGRSVRLKLEITGKGCEITPAVQEYIRDKFEHLDRYFNRIDRLHVVVSEEPGLFHVEAIAAVKRGNSIVAAKKKETLFDAIDTLHATLIKNVSQAKDRLKSHRLSVERREVPPTATSEDSDETE